MAKRAGGPIVIVGAGLTGGTAAKELRKQGYVGELLILAEEPSLPFGRPPLTKGYLRGEEELSGWMVAPRDWYKAHQVQFLPAKVVSVDPAAKQVKLESGDAIRYERLLLATGGRNRHFDAPGSSFPGVHQLRTIAECDSIKRAAKTGARAVVIGSGFIGSEVAASLRQLGLKVTSLMRGRAPLDAVLGPEVGGVFAAIHRDAGIELVVGDEAVRFEGSSHVERVVTKKGRRIACDLVILAVGIEPNVEIVRGSRVAVRDGILVDATCRTNIAGIFAAGDVANHLHPIFGRVRVEHYNNAEKMGAAAAKSMLGSRSAYRYMHSFWSDQLEHKLEYIGHVRSWDRFVVRGSLDERKFVGFYLKAGKLRAAVGLDRGGDPEQDRDGELAKAGRLIAKGARPSPAMLADENANLESS
ncbi:MAG: 3-phenylpropionate/trans-cinnamate dioxygenase ferredoxin reductase component [Chloroflexota bacterium]|nr:3-phenylpropionate/trans-cinnamate dioxygenase ferredoxin reductase component [Chloroflexota bacterium]